MEKNRDVRRANVSAVNGLPKRRQRIIPHRDSTDQDTQMDLQETVRLGDQEQLHKKDREFQKRRRGDRPMVQQRSDDAESNRENESTDSSDEEYYEEEEDTRINRNRTNQPSPTSSSLSNNRRGLRTFRSSPVLRAAADEMFGVPIPRRARSSSTKRLHEYCNLASGAFAEELSHRKFSPSSATVSLIGSGSASPSSSGASMKKKAKSADRRTPSFGVASNSKPAAIQDDIEIEVAEALFDLMKQSQSQFQSSQGQEEFDRDGKNTASDELKMSKAESGKDENNAFSVQNEPSIKVNAETVSSDSLKLLKREGRIEKEREKFPDDPAQELVNGDGFVNKVKVGPPIEIESPSCVKVNACDIQDPTRTKGHYEAIIAEVKRKSKLEIDLMALPPLPQSRERDASVELGTDTEMMTQVQKKSESISKDGRLIGMQEEKIEAIDSSQLQMEKDSHSNILNVSSNATQGRKEQKNQSPTSLLPFPIGMSSWPGVLPHPGYMPPLQAILQLNGSSKSSMILQHPKFKFSQRRAKRCTTHHFLAHNINNHQELVKNCLSSGSTAFYGAKSANTKYMLPSAQSFIAGHPLHGDFQGGQNLATVSAESVKDKLSDAAVAFDANATTKGKSVLQQAPHQAAASSFMRGSGFIFPFGPHQTTMMAPANSSGPPQSCASSVGISSLPSNPAGRQSALPNASAAMSLNHPLFPSSEAYMAMLQNSGCPIPLPSFKGGTPSLPYFSPSLYHSPMFNVTQNQQHLAIPHAPQTTNSSSHKQPHSQQSEKPPQLPLISSMSETEITRKSGASVAHGLAQPMDLSIGGVGNKNIDHPQQGSKGRVELVPQAFATSFGSTASTAPALNFSSMGQNSAMFHIPPEMSWIGSQMAQQKNFQASDGKFLSNGGQSFNFPKSDCKDISMGPPKFDGLARSFNFLTSSLTGNHHQQQQLLQVQNSQLQQLSGTAQVKSSGPNAIHGSFLTSSIFPSNSPSIFTLPNDDSSVPQLMKSSHGQTHIPSFKGHKNEGTCSRNTGVIKQRTASPTASTVSGQEAEAGTSQKTSPSCRRNVPSILSMCPSSLPELKY
ncbi:hypothetical protein ACS0TY_007583 [Phlomoides rotata]